MGKKSRRLVAVLAAFALAALGMTACQKANESVGASAGATEKQTVSGAEAGAAEGGEFVLGSATELSNFDPFASITADVRSVNFNIFEGLVKVKPNGSFIPAVASDYAVSDDHLTYTFTLREGVKFHNGNDVTAEDVLYSIQKAIDSKITGYDQIDRFELNDEGKLVLRLTDANANYIPYLTSAIVPKDYEEQSLKPVGTGPYKLTDYTEQEHIILEKNGDYWGEGGHLDKITIKFTASQADSLVLFLAGTIDGFGASAATVEQMDQENVNLYITYSNAVQLLALNNNYEPLKDQRVREAINYAVSADEIIDTAFYGYGTKVGSGLIPALEKYYDDSLTEAYPQNVDKAKELLAAAGYEDGFTLTITVPSVYQAHIDTAEVILNELEAVGIHATIKQVDWATWLENVYQGRDYEATVISLDASLAYPTAFLSRYVSDASNNFVNFSSDAYDEVYAKAVASTDETERVELFRKLQQILSEESASVFLQDVAGFTVYNKKFAGYVNYPLYASDYSAIYRVEE